MTFGYDARAAFGNSTADIEDHIMNLVSSLVNKRQEDDARLRLSLSEGLRQPFLTFSNSSEADMGSGTAKTSSVHCTFAWWNHS